MLRYNLRSSKKPVGHFCPSQKTKMKPPSKVTESTIEPVRKKSKPSSSIFSLNTDCLLQIFKHLDVGSCIAVYSACHYFKDLLDQAEEFWKLLCLKADILPPKKFHRNDIGPEVTGFKELPMRDKLGHLNKWRKTYLRGLQARKNIIEGNFQGWRIYANLFFPMAKMKPDRDILELKKSLRHVRKLDANDDLKIDWDEKHMVIFHFFRSAEERALIWVYNISAEPRYMYFTEKGTEYITDKVFVHKGYVVTVPSWPLRAHALVMTLSISNKLDIVGKHFFEEPDKQQHIDQLWMHTALRVVKEADQALVVYRAPNWECLVLELPSCCPLSRIDLSRVSLNFDCQQIRSFGYVSILLFTHTAQETQNTLVTIETCTRSSPAKLRSVYNCQEILDMALFPGVDSICLLKKNGNIVMYDANRDLEVIKIKNPLNETPREGLAAPEYQMFVNPYGQICLLQSIAEFYGGRFVKVYNFDGTLKYSINLDLWMFGLSRDESLCMFTNGLFLCVGNSQKIIFFSIKTGHLVSTMAIPIHLERSKGKDHGSCMYDPTGLHLMTFDDEKLIVVHDYERTFPSVLDIYKF